MRRPGWLVAVLAAATTVAIAADPPRRIYIAPDDHTDYVWTADAETYRRVFVEMIDYYLDQADRTSGNAPEHQGRWNCDGNLWMWEYERSKSPEQFARFVSRLKDGHISVPLNAAVSCYGGQPMEAVLRGMYYAGRMERKLGVRFPLAVAMENQTLPYGLGGLWAGAGAKYSWRGICGCASRLAPVKHTRRPHEIYWWGAPDGTRILMKWNSLLNEGSKESNQCVGGYAEAFDPAASLRFVESDKRFRDAWPYDVVGVFGKGWDRLKTIDDDVVDLARKETTASRQVIVSNETDFFRDFEARYGKSLANHSASFGNEWDLYIASVSEVAGRVRRAVEKLRTAEALAALVSTKRPDFLKGREAERDRAFLNLGLFWEHNWTSDGPISRSARAEWGRKVAGEIEGYVNRLESDAASSLGAMIAAKGSAARYFVFNAMGTKRTDVADLAWDDEADVHVVDVETGSEVPSQRVREWSRTNAEGRTAIRILARDVPALGYRVYEVRKGKGQQSADAARFSGGVFESDRYRITVAGRGAITSLIDKRGGGREWVKETVNDISQGDGVLTLEDAGPVSVTVRADVRSPLARTTRITVYRDLDRIDIDNEIKENFGGVLAWKFGFAVDAPDVWHEEVGAVIRARLTTGGGHYSPVHSRLDWLSLGHFAAMNGTDGAGITLSNSDLSFMKLGDSEVRNGVSHLDTATPRISVLAGGQVDGPTLGIPSQGGDSYFLQRFSLRPHARYRAAESMRFALEHQNPLRAGRVTGDGAYPGTTYSFGSFEGEDAMLWALKPSEDGIHRGVTARVWNLAATERRATFQLSEGIANAERVTHIETSIAPARVERGQLTISMKPAEISTYRLERVSK
jgi:alpha-mannosidase